MTDSVDSSSITGLLGGATTLGFGLMWVWEKFLKGKIDRANTDVAVTAAGGMELVLSSMKDRIDSLENEMKTTREELQESRRHQRRQLLHIFKLEGIMRKAGLDVPSFEESEVGQ